MPLTSDGMLGVIPREKHFDNQDGGRQVWSVNLTTHLLTILYAFMDFLLRWTILILILILELSNLDVDVNISVLERMLSIRRFFVHGLHVQRNKDAAKKDS